MARYILLGKFSLNGVKGVINSNADRASIAKKAVEAAGGKLIAFDFTRGPFDFVGIAAGALRYPIKRFLIIVWVGKTLKGLIIAHACLWIVEWIRWLA